MILVCPNCATSFTINATLPPEGRKVRCSKCSHVWSATPPPEPVFDPPPELVEIVDDDPFKDLFETQEPEEPAVQADDPAPEPAAVEPPADETESTSLLDDLEEIDIGWAEDEEAPTPEPEESFDASFEDAGPAENIETAARVAAPAPPQQRSLARALAGWGAFAAIAAMIIGGAMLFRDSVVSALPASAAIYERLGMPVNLRGMEIRDLSYGRDIDNGQPVITVKGTIVNITERVVAVPDLRFSLRDGMRRELYTWTTEPKERVLTPAASVKFKTRLTSPPLEARDVEVRFARPGKEG